MQSIVIIIIIIIIILVLISTNVGGGSFCETQDTTGGPPLNFGQQSVGASSGENTEPKMDKDPWNTNFGI